MNTLHVTIQGNADKEADKWKNRNTMLQDQAAALQ